MALNWNGWIKREWARVANAASYSASPLRMPSFADVNAVYEHYALAARSEGRYPEIALDNSGADSLAYNMARCVWLANELALGSEAVVSGWRLSSARRRAYNRYNHELVPLGRSAGLRVVVSRSDHGDAAWWIVRTKWLEAQVGHMVLSGAASAAVAPRTVAEVAVAGAVGPAEILNWESLTYGVEIECIRPSNVSMAEFARRITEAGVPCNAEHYNHNVRSAWKIVTDGSLSDRNGVGMEVVSPILRSAADFEQIRTVSAVLLDGRCKINKTCGLHVHVGLPRREHRLPINVLRIYNKFEPVIDTLMPPSRRGSANGYARPTAFSERMATASDLNVLRIAYGHDRYRKVNLESIWRHGTLEFRQHAGTIEAEKIIAWATLVLKLTAMANSAPELPTGAPTLEGLLALIDASEEAKGFWARRQAALNPAMAAAA